jgi:hypothetical protein
MTKQTHFESHRLQGRRVAPVLRPRSHAAAGAGGHAMIDSRDRLLKNLVEPPLDTRRFLFDVVVVDREDFQAR